MPRQKKAELYRPNLDKQSTVDFLRAMSVSGCMTEEQIKQCGISENALRGFCRHLVEKYDVIEGTENKTYYFFTKAGKNFIKKMEDKLGYGNVYGSNSVSHDRVLCDAYLSLNRETRESWRSETELSLQMKQKEIDEDEIKRRIEEEIEKMREYDRVKAERIREEYENSDRYFSPPDGVYIVQKTIIRTVTEEITEEIEVSEIHIVEATSKWYTAFEILTKQIFVSVLYNVDIEETVFEEIRS